MAERKALGKFDGQRRKFRGIFVRLGTKRGWQGAVDDTILLKNVVDVISGKEVTDHLWFNLTTGFQDAMTEIETEIELRGKILEFEARVTQYEKGYKGGKAEEIGEAWSATDWKLSRPTRIKIVEMKED